MGSARESPSAADVVIIGSGLAGAATAYALTRLGVRKIVIVEKEKAPGLQASGRGAAMVRQVVSSPELRPLVVEGARFLEAPPPDLSLPVVFRRSGSLTIAEGAAATQLKGSVPAMVQDRVPASWVDRSDIEHRVSVTAGGSFEGGVHCSGDGVVDVTALLSAYLKAAEGRGARLLLGRRVRAIPTAGGRVTGVQTDRERIDTAVVVNAAGAWARDVALMAGACDLPARPFRSHLMVSAPMNGIGRDWPSVWDVSHEIYFRPESGALLLSPCDRTPHPPGNAAPDPAATRLLKEKLARFLPRLSQISVRRAWAGLSTETSDGNAIVGPDPWLSGFVWCAGLGRNGVTVSAAAGRLAARAVREEPVPPACAPRRFVASGTT